MIHSLTEFVSIIERIRQLVISGTLNSDIHVPESNKKLFADLVSDMKKALKKSSAIREA